MTLDSLPDLDTSGLCLVKTLSTALTCWPYRNMALRDGARTSTHNSWVAKRRTASIPCRAAPPRPTAARSSRTSRCPPGRAQRRGGGGWKLRARWRGGGGRRFAPLFEPATKIEVLILHERKQLPVAVHDGGARLVIFRKVYHADPRIVRHRFAEQVA